MCATTANGYETRPKSALENIYPGEAARGFTCDVIAMCYGRAVRCGPCTAKGCDGPVIPSFMLSTKEGRKGGIDPVIDPKAPDGSARSRREWER